MKKNKYFLALTFSIFFTLTSNALAEEAVIDNKKLSTVVLKYITGSDVISVLKSLIDKSVSISEKDNVLFINGTEEKTKTLLHIISKIDTPPSPLTIEFIASNKVINFNQINTYQAEKNNTSQSMAITERQWVTLNAALSIPVAARKHNTDGTEVQSFKYKKINKSYIFKVHEFSDWAVIQVGLNSSSDIEVNGLIKNTMLDTTIIGKTDEWQEVASSKRISNNGSSKIYSTNKDNKKHIYLYVKVKKPNNKLENTIKN